jgi:hypothetical protein
MFEALYLTFYRRNIFCDVNDSSLKSFFRATSKKKVVLDCFLIHFNRLRKIYYILICTLFRCCFCSVLKIIFLAAVSDTAKKLKALWWQAVRHKSGSFIVNNLPTRNM